VIRPVRSDEAIPGMTSATVLDAIELRCERGDRLLFDRLSFQLAPGHCLHIAGDNGAGKTSLLRILCGLLRATAGEVHWKGRPISSVRDEYGTQILYVGHSNGVKDELTPTENLLIWAKMAGVPVAVERLSDSLRQLAIGQFAHWPTGRLSQGQRRRVNLARLALCDRAKLWILDEPFNALDRSGVSTLNAMIERKLASGASVVLTTHQAWEAPARVTRIDLSGRGAR
jgi:heme exporter protein A